jgi:DNA-binding transcriptional LysR family regulator
VAARELLLDRLDQLLSGGVDVAFTRLLPGQADVELEVIAEEARVVVLPTTHPLADRTELHFADLRDESFVTNPVVEVAAPPRRWLAEQVRHGLPGRVAARATSVQEILTLVAAGRGVCLVTASVAGLYPRADLRYVKVKDADPAVVSLAWHRGERRRSVQVFIDTVRRVYSNSESTETAIRR